ncbi:type I polyketide synthase [Teichococcus oryzae]|uniref:SDR family NAD(P)-dependent oxidoreductase n=1 Tax=Teichococcus oryzae TaxID=1608942 RepID=A0A5B2TJ87_9PROT|nr:type I polyketide synthase [Pseudoroseomonas oryzae]KAA2213860.1 SDR family NAD(P)-dependent oxidoreductase [Pseudoroseomonas oryzae]
MTEGKSLPGATHASHGGGPIAIVGAACRFPGAASLEGFWRMLAAGTDAVGTLPPDRFAQAAFLHPRKGEPGRSYSFAAGHLGDITGFDAPAFGLSPREAAEMDPQQRLLLEVASEALEDAGWPAGQLAGRPVGVWIGGSSTDHAELRLSDPAGTDRYFMTGNTLSILSNRLTNVFDLRGPGQTVDTACSSSLVALHAAVAAIRAGQVEAALVGGVQLLLSPFAFAGFSRAGMLSSRGRCQAFDAAADGYVRGEGAGVVVLKPLAAALAAGDAVRGVILATGTNAAGRTIGLSLPNREAQAALLQRVLAEADADPARLAYFEAHGTGTQVGDPAESWAIGTTLARHRAAPLPVGSVKTNIGHLEPASGMAGLLKAMLVLERGLVPPNLHFNSPNPQIDFTGLNIRVPTALERLDPDASALTGVNSFGFGGTNASVLLGRAPRPAAMPAGGPAPAGVAEPPLVLTARSAAALKALAQDWRTRLDEAPASPALRRGALRHRDLHPHRLVLRGDLAAQLDGWLAGGRPAGATHGIARSGAAGPVAFVFSGNGAQFAGMAREAMAHNAAFRRAVEQADAILAPLAGWSGAALLAAGVSAEALSGTDHAQPLLFLVQVGIVAALAEHGLRADLCLGHSVGEVAAAWAAGILGLEQAVRLVVARSRAQHSRRGIGRMAAIGAGAEAVLPLIEALAPDETGWRPEIAARNAPGSVTVAGPEAALDRLVAEAKARRWAAVKLDLDYAFHSAAMDPVRDALAADLAGLRPAEGRLGFLSAVTGTKLPGPALDAGYWWHNLREPVRFQEAVQAAVDAGARFFVEIGPHPVLQSYLRDSLRAAEAEAPVLPTLSRRDGAGDPFPAIADRALAQGAALRDAAALRGPAEWRGLPHTPFDRQRAWFTPTAESARLTDPLLDHPLLGFRQGQDALRWSRLLDTALEPWLADHKLGGEPVLPAAAMLDMALAIAALRFPDAPALELRDMQILRPLPLSAESARELRCTLEPETNTVLLESRPRLSGEGWTLHARCEAAAATLAALPAPMAPDLAGGTVLPLAESLEIARRFHLDYGPAFQVLRENRLSADRRSAVATLALPPAAPSDDAGWLLHPVRLDGLLQGLIGLLADGAPADGRAVVPVRLGRLVLRRGAPVPVSGELRLLHSGERSGLFQLALRDGSGQVVGWLDEAWMQRIRLAPRASAEDCLFRIAPQPSLAPAVAPEEPPALQATLRAAQACDARRDLGETALLLEGHLVASAHAALSSLCDAGRRLPGRHLSPYAAALLRALAEDGLAEPDGPHHWRLAPAEELPAPDAIWQAVLAESPGLAHELAWLALAAERMPAALAAPGRAEALPPPPDAAGFGHLAAVLAEAVRHFAASWPAGRPLRVLEVGAQGGPLTRALLAVLGASGRQVRYVIAGAAGDARAAAIPPHAETISVRTEAWTPEAAGLPPGQADLVVGIAAAANSRRGTALLPVLREALAPAGTLLLAEPAPGRAWDFSCGQGPEWWRGDASPLPAAAEWEGAARGWASLDAAPLISAPWPALLLAARAPSHIGARAEQPAPAAGPAAAPPLQLHADGASAPLAAALEELFRAAGLRISRHALDDAAKQAPRGLSGTRIVALAAPDEAALPETLAQLTALAEAARGSAAGLVLVTGDAGTLPEAAALFGLGRVLANEMPELAPLRIGLSAALKPADAAARLLPELLGGMAEPEPEIVLTPEARLVPRLRPGAAPAGAPRGPARLVVRQPGQLGTLEWEALELPAPGPEEVVVRVEAAGLNFRDLMWAQGLLPEEALLAGFAGPTLGMEMAGIVEQAGPDSPFRPGDAVFGFAPAALASRVRTRAGALATLPEGLGFAAAAAVPVAFLTAVYSLEHCARIGPGETVLIHGGAGAVGLAALQVALAAGARVAATAGSPAKRAFLRACGAELVLDSRDPGFADQLRAAWPEGVDVVLNSLAGEAMERSLGLVKPFGRFVELGKRDFFENRRVGLRPYRNNLTYFGVDVDQLPKARPDLARALLRNIADRFATGALRPIPHAACPAEEVETAFRTLQASRHIGKLVLTPPALPADERPEAGWTPPAGTILVVGGTGGFGFECAKWLAAQGATQIALLSRRGGTAPGAEAAVTALAALGARATVHAADATDAAALEAALAEIRAEGPPLVGVVQAAAVFDDGAASALDAARFRRVLAPKLAAARHLDRLTRHDPIALFLLFSSATTAMGNPGQGNYVAANMALEALARRRHAEGLPALAVGWGPIADAGILAQQADTAETLARRLGVEAMAAAEALSALPAMLRSGAPVIGMARIGWREAGRILPILAEPLFDAVRGRAEASPEGALRDHLLALAPEAARALLRQTVQEEAARILRLPPEAVPTDAPVAGLGLDSLGGLELRGALEQRLGMPVPLASVTEDLTIDLLARKLGDALASGRAEEESVAELVEQFEPSSLPGARPPGHPPRAEAAE